MFNHIRWCVSAWAPCVAQLRASSLLAISCNMEWDNIDQAHNVIICNVEGSTCPARGGCRAGVSVAGALVAQCVV